ncbi:MAG: sigma-70 family RNA polymerase sigma factor [Verrucomicrobia bacterium]|nr:sigma-70 family RNA polymerase sigma factor [Verrucomicrobiota bacterium]
MTEDTELLRRYAEEGSQEAFAEVVHRHVNLVYSAAVRQLNGDTHRAADVTQAVFTDLARKARYLARHEVLSGWLFTSTRYAARNLVRGEQRRLAREQEAWAMETVDRDGEVKLDWERVRPVLDDVLAELNRTDREAVLLRFFEGRDYAGVGARLNVPANTARMRVERALDKLRERLAHRGVTSTSAALAAVLAGQAVAAAPAGLASAVAGTALAGATASGGVLAITFLTMNKLQMATTGVVLAAGAAGLIVQSTEARRIEAEIAALREQEKIVTALRAENQALARRAGEVAELRRDDAQLAQLRDDAAALQARLKAEELRKAEAARLAAARAPLTGPVFDISKVDRTPAPQFQARPQYPSELRQLGLGGEAVVEFVVDAEGVVRNARAVRSALKAPDGKGEPAGREPFVVQATGVPGGGASDRAMAEKFEAAALEAVSKWRFSPGEKGGQKVNTRLQVPIIFTLSTKPGPAPTLWF